MTYPIQPDLGGNGLDWLCYLAGNSHDFFIFSVYVIVFNYLIKNPQTTNTLTSLNHIIGGVKYNTWLSL